MSRAAYYATHGRLIAERWCGYDLCRRRRCFGELSRRNVKRAAKAMWAKQAANDYAEAYDEYAWLAVPNRFALAPTRLDYAPDAEEIANERRWSDRFFGENDHEWTELAELRVPLLSKAG